MPPDSSIVELTAVIARLEGRVDTLMWVIGGVGTMFSALIVTLMVELFSLSRRVSELGARVSRLEGRVELLLDTLTKAKS